MVKMEINKLYTLAEKENIKLYNCSINSLADYFWVTTDFIQNCLEFYSTKDKVVNNYFIF